MFLGEFLRRRESWQPYFAVPKGEDGAQHMMRRVAPRRVWPPIAFGASMACWYEHVSRTICLLICKNHRVWDFLFKLITRNRYSAVVYGFYIELRTLPTFHPIS